jgi:hypothetical protein
LIKLTELTTQRKQETQLIRQLENDRSRLYDQVQILQGEKNNLVEQLDQWHQRCESYGRENEFLKQQLKDHSERCNEQKSRIASLQDDRKSVEMDNRYYAALIKQLREELAESKRRLATHEEETHTYPSLPKNPVSGARHIVEEDMDDQVIVDILSNRSQSPTSKRMQRLLAIQRGVQLPSSSHPPSTASFRLLPSPPIDHVPISNAPHTSSSSRSQHSKRSPHRPRIQQHPKSIVNIPSTELDLEDLELISALNSDSR